MESPRGKTVYCIEFFERPPELGMNSKVRVSQQSNKSDYFELDVLHKGRTTEEMRNYIESQLQIVKHSNKIQRIYFQKESQTAYYHTRLIESPRNRTVYCVEMQQINQ